MAEVTPPLFQTIDAEYDGSHLGLPYRDFIAEGVVGSSALAVTQRGAGANMSVDVAAGAAWILGDDSASAQPCYRVYNDATKNVAVTAADGTNPRIDLVIAEVRDAAFSGVSTDWRLRVVAGTPAGSPSAPATPSNAIVLARLSVPAGDTTIGTAQITDYRSFAMVGATVSPLYVTSLPTQPYDGQEIYYGADPTNGIIWHLRYRSGASGSYKWEYIGGPAMWAEVETGETTSSSSFAALATAGPSVTVPLAGDYGVRWGCETSGTVATGVYYHGIKRGGAATVDADSHRGQPAGTNYVGAGQGSRFRRFLALAASTDLVSQYKANTGTGTFTYRWLEVTPIRVG